jgi:hypothetical protein
MTLAAASILLFYLLSRQSESISWSPLFCNSVSSGFLSRGFVIFLLHFSLLTTRLLGIRPSCVSALSYFTSLSGTFSPQTTHVRLKPSDLSARRRPSLQLGHSALPPYGRGFNIFGGSSVLRFISTMSLYYISLSFF